ncbi:MAG: hypothetical protein U5L72_13440 [Bacteroidales bacterium]|nr:hypothetical protein [Bacteroidales bacterium]
MPAVPEGEDNQNDNIDSEQHPVFNLLFDLMRLVVYIHEIVAEGSCKGSNAWASILAKVDAVTPIRNAMAPILPK